MFYGPRVYRHSRLKVVKADLLPHQQANMRKVTHVYTDPCARQRGEATELMRRLCAEADRFAKVLILEVGAFGDESDNLGASDDVLRHWYGKFGFTPLPEMPFMLARAPGITR